MAQNDDLIFDDMDALTVRPSSDNSCVPSHRPPRELCLVTPSCRRAWDREAFRPIQAGSAYTGPFSRKCQTYAERFHPGAWCILDPRHGFLFPDEVIRRGHEACLYRPSTGPISVGELKSQVRARKLDRYERIIVMGGHKFICLMEEAFPNRRVQAPLAGVGGIGMMMKEINLALGSGQRL